MSRFAVLILVAGCGRPLVGTWEGTTLKCSNPEHDGQPLRMDIVESPTGGSLLLLATDPGGAEPTTCETEGGELPERAIGDAIETSWTTTCGDESLDYVLSGTFPDARVDTLVGTIGWSTAAEDIDEACAFTVNLAD